MPLKEVGKPSVAMRLLDRLRLLGMSKSYQSFISNASPFALRKKRGKCATHEI
jgi:hypothetical protein